MDNSQRLKTMAEFVENALKDLKPYFEAFVYDLSSVNNLKFKNKGVLPIVGFYYGYFKNNEPKIGTVVVTYYKEQYQIVRVKKGKNNIYLDFELFCPIALKNFIDFGGLEVDFFVSEKLVNKPIPLEDIS